MGFGGRVGGKKDKMYDLAMGLGLLVWHILTSSMGVQSGEYSFRWRLALGLVTAFTMDEA